MANYTPVKSTVSMKLDLGTVDGKKTTRTVSLSKVRASAGASDVNDTMDALSAVLSYPVIERYKTDTDGVAA